MENTQPVKHFYLFPPALRYLSMLFVLLTCPVSIFSQSYKDTTFTNYFDQSPPGWIASDGAISLALPDGRSMWMMGDSHIDQQIDGNGEIPCLYNSRNCVLVQDNTDLSQFETYYNPDGATGFERQFVKMPNDPMATYWPASGTVRADTAFTFWLRYIPNPNQPNQLLFTTMVVAKIKLPEIELVEVTPVQYPEIVYGMSVIWDAATQYYYIYGRRIEALVFKPLLARCTDDNLLGDWEFYSGNDTWSDDPSAAVIVGNEASAQFSVFYMNEEYHLYFQKNGFLTCGLGRQMFISSSANPEGPFADPLLVYTMEDMFDGEYPKTYNGQAHPQFTENNELLISYNLNKTCPSPCSTNPFVSRYDPDMYRPNFARVPVCMFAKDVESPVILSQQDDIVIPADSNCLAEIPDLTVGIVATDNCDSNLIVTQTPAAGTVISGADTTNIMLTVTDASGNIAEVTIDVVVDDVTYPEITCPPDQAVVANSTGFYAIVNNEFDPVAIDNCQIINMVNDWNQSSTLAGSGLPPGLHTITWTVTDIGEKTARCQMNITVEEVTGLEAAHRNGTIIYPNPTNGLLNLSSDLPAIQVKVVDLSGKTILELEGSALDSPMDVSLLSNGLYIIYVLTDRHLFTSKLVKF